MLLLCLLKQGSIYLPRSFNAVVDAVGHPQAAVVVALAHFHAQVHSVWLFELPYAARLGRLALGIRPG